MSTGLSCGITPASRDREKLISPLETSPVVQTARHDRTSISLAGQVDIAKSLLGRWFRFGNVLRRRSVLSLAFWTDCAEIPMAGTRLIIAWFCSCAAVSCAAENGRPKYSDSSAATVA